MDTGKNCKVLLHPTCNLAQREAFFRACRIAEEVGKAYAEIFVRERIGADLLPDLSEENLMKLGIDAFGDRVRLDIKNIPFGYLQPARLRGRDDSSDRSRREGLAADGDQLPRERSVVSTS